MIFFRPILVYSLQQELILNFYQQIDTPGAEYSVTLLHSL